MRASAFLLGFSVLAMTSVVYGQVVKTAIPFAFKAKDKTFQPGNYRFENKSGQAWITVTGEGKGNNAMMMIITRMAAGVHTSMEDAHVVFDKVGDVYYLSELWVPGKDGFMLLTTKQKHEHEMVNVPMTNVEK